MSTPEDVAAMRSLLSDPGFVARADQVHAELEHFMEHELKHWMAKQAGDEARALDEAMLGARVLEQLEPTIVQSMLVVLAQQALDLDAKLAMLEAPSP